MNCSVCSVTLAGPTEIASHFTGKKHLKAVANVDLRLKQEGRAVYVTRLGKLSLTDIASFFATFGEVGLVLNSNSFSEFESGDQFGSGKGQEGS